MKHTKEKPNLKYIGIGRKSPTENYTQVPNEVIFGLGKYSELTGNDVRIYAILLKEVKFRNDFNKQVDIDGDAYCYMTQEQLGDKAKIGSKKTVAASVERLEALGLVYASFNGLKKCYTYFVALPDKVENNEKQNVPVDKIGKRLSEDQLQKKKQAREKKQASKKATNSIKDFLAGKDEEFPDF